LEQFRTSFTGQGPTHTYYHSLTLKKKLFWLEQAVIIKLMWTDKLVFTWNGEVIDSVVLESEDERKQKQPRKVLHSRGMMNIEKGRDPTRVRQS